MKIVINLIAFIAFQSLFVSCVSSPRLKESRTLLKEYAYCKCLEYASHDTSFFRNDISISVYKDIAHYNFDVYKKIDSLARQEAYEIKPSQIADYQNKKAILSDCFLFYKSKKLDSMVKSMDKKMREGWKK